MYMHKHSDLQLKPGVFRGTVFHDYSPTNHLLGRLQSAKIAVFLEFRNHQFLRSRRHNHRLYITDSTSLYSQQIYFQLCANNRRSAHGRERPVRNRHSSRHVTDKTIKISGPKRCFIWVGDHQRCGRNYSISDCFRAKNRRWLHVKNIFIHRFGTFLTMLFDFLYLFFFSLTLGLVFGFGLSYLLKIN